MRNFFRFIAVFFGTPRRAATTIGVMVLAAIVEKFFPGILGEYAYRMVRATVVPVAGAVLRVLCEILGPFLQPILTLAIIAFGFKVMFGRGKKGGR
jgi:type IV secretory pathway VirB2 component (pilin)